MSIQPTQPQSIGGVLDTMFQLYKATLVKLLPLSLLMAVANSPPSIYAFVRGSALDPANPAAMLATFTSPGYWAAVLVGWLAVTWTSAAGMLKSASIGAGNEVSAGTALQRSLGRVPWLVIAVILYILVIGLLALFAMVPYRLMAGVSVSSIAVSSLLSLPCLIVAIALVLFTPVCLLDNKGPIGALAGSRRLVWGNWWRTLAILTVGGIIIFVFYLIAAALIGAVLPIVILSGSENAAMVGMLSTLLIGVLVSLLMTPFFSALFLSLYWDLKLRKEGGDLAARIGALDPA
jgi:hypothetical protein